MARLNDRLKRMRARVLASLNDMESDEDEVPMPSPVPEGEVQELSDEEMQDVVAPAEGEDGEVPVVTTEDGEVAPAPVPAEGEDGEVPVVTTEDGEDEGKEYTEVESALSNSKNVNMYLLKSGDNKDYAWVLSADVTPVALISFNNVKNKEAMRAHFVTSNFRDTVFESFKKIGVRKTLNILKASILSNGKIVQPTVTKTVDVKGIRDRALRDFTKKMALASASYNKNLFPNGHALKEAFFDVISENPKMNPAELVEEAFSRGGNKYINDLISKAEEWMNLDPTAFKAVSSVLASISRPLAELDTELGSEEDVMNSDQIAEEDAFGCDQFSDEDECCDGDMLASALAGNSCQFRSMTSPSPKSKRDAYRRKLLEFGSGRY